MRVELFGVSKLFCDYALGWMFVLCVSLLPGDWLVTFPGCPSLHNLELGVEKLLCFYKISTYFDRKKGKVAKNGWLTAYEAENSYSDMTGFGRKS